MKRLAILGASGHGNVIAEIALSNDWNSVDFYDDAFPVKALLDSYSIIGAGSIVISDISNSVTAVSVPSKIIR